MCHARPWTISPKSLEISTTDVASIVGFYTLYHEEPGGRYRIQVCTDLPCALRGADEFLHELCERLGHSKVGETTPDGLFTVEEVKCLAGCHRAPMFQVQGDGEIVYHENQTVELTMAWIEEVRAARLQAGQEASAMSEHILLAPPRYSRPGPAGCLPAERRV